MRHRCLIYNGSPYEHLKSIAAFIIANLKAHNKCLYLNSPSMVAGMRCALASEIDLDAELKRGARSLTSDQSHLRDGKFDSVRMLQLLEAAVQEALDRGFSGLFASGDMTWEFGGHLDLKKLIDYEIQLDSFIAKNEALSGICQYHTEVLPLGAIEIAKNQHSEVYLNDTLNQISRSCRSVSQ